MEGTNIKFYQTGTFTVGNRLLSPEQRSGQSSMERYNSLTSGHRACQGCGEALGARYVVDAAMRATEGNLIACNATGCLEVFSTPYPETSWQLPWVHSLFGNAAAVASGMAASMTGNAELTGMPLIRVLAQGGDGGTTDIGFGCLSGMFDRNDDVLYVCYDNEGYMNTGVQRSSATPPAARTATTQAIGPDPGNPFGTGKDVPLIAMAHGIPYVASYIQVLTPCPLGWGCKSSESVKVARMAVETGLFPVFEAEYGEITSVKTIRNLRPVEDYLRIQKRYAHLFGAKADLTALTKIRAIAERNVRTYGLIGNEREDAIPPAVQADERAKRL